MINKAKKTGKVSLVLIYIVTVFVTMFYVFSYSDIEFNAKPKYGLQGNPIYDADINFKYTDENDGFSHNESFPYHVFASITNTIDVPFYIKVPQSFPFIYSSIINKYRANGNEKSQILRKKIEYMLSYMFNGNSKNFFRNMSKSNQLYVDEQLVVLIAKKYKVNPYFLYKYYMSIPINHEMGHAYTQKSAYRLNGVEYNTSLFMSEYTAEYIAAITSLSMVNKDILIKNKESFKDALATIYILSRGNQLDMLSGHSGTAFVALLLMDKTSVLYKDVDTLSKTTYPKIFVESVVNDIFNQKTKKRLTSDYLDIYFAYKGNEKKPMYFLKISEDLKVKVLSILDDINETIKEDVLTKNKEVS